MVGKGEALGRLRSLRAERSNPTSSYGLNAPKQARGVAP
jgi:hypothetical protein